MDKAKCNNDDNGTAAVQATTAKNNQAFQARGRATQDIVENTKEVLDSLRETAKKLSDCNDKNHELAEERLKQGRQHQKRMGEINKRVEDRAAARVAQRTTREHEMNARQDKATAASAKQHEEWMAMASTTSATPPDDAQLPWSSYEEFWVSVGNISQDIQDGVASAVPQFGDLIGLARDKNFKVALTETDIPGLAGLVACRIAEKIHVHVYGK